METLVWDGRVVLGAHFGTSMERKLATVPTERIGTYTERIHLYDFHGGVARNVTERMFFRSTLSFSLGCIAGA